MRSGKLRHTMAIQERTRTPDGIGGFSETWADVSGMGKVRAGIWKIKADELVESKKIQLETVYNIRIRYRPGLDSSMRIYWADRGKTFNIISMVNWEERNIMIDFICTDEGV